MKKQALRKDFIMEIKGSLGRFLSIFFIVAIGVAFFSGIRSAEPDMRVTGDEYFDAHNLMDVQVISTLGLTKDDISALGKVKGIKAIEPGYSTDAICTVNDSQKVVHIFSTLPTMNQLTVSEGRLPKAKDECLVDEDFIAGSGYKVGDQITFASGKTDPITDTLVADTFTIVGVGSSPCYISFYRGSSTIGTGTLNGFVAVDDSAFDMEVYTEIYATVKGAKDTTAFTDAYDSCVKKVTDAIDGISDEREELRSAEVKDEAQDKLDDARKELEDKKKEANDKLSDAKAKIDDGVNQLNDAKEQLADGQAEIDKNSKLLKEKQQELDENQATLDEKQAELSDGQAQLDEKVSELENNQAQVTDGQNQLDDGQAQITEGQNQINAGYDEIDSQVNAQKEPLDQALAAGMMDQASYDAAIAQIQAAVQPMRDQLAAKQQELNAQQETLRQKRAELNAAQDQINDGWTQISAAQDELNAGQEQINDGQVQINDGQQQINDGWVQIEDAKAELSSGESEIAENEQKLVDAQKEYDDGKKEADDKIADGEKKLSDAQDEVDKIENAKWYVNDRGSLTEYDGYGENADRMRAIGKVFPLIFFLVAALISLTTMTRMVEEQRTQIGTLKALGYGKASIAAKYLGYAFLATVGGCIFGVLVGEKVLPAIIIIAYRIMYLHMDTLDIPYNMYYAFMSAGAAIFCTIGATVFSCVKELRESAASLMRPPAPKKGKRVFLERVPFIWKRLSFIWKATVRNLMRYKKRFFMTIFGIGGCTGLLLVGFGLKDSIFDIAVIQYNEVQLFDGTIIMEDNAKLSDEKALIDSLNKNAKVKGTEEILLQTVSINNGKTKKDVFLCVPENMDTINDFVVFQNRTTGEIYTLGDDEVILTEKMAKTLNVKKGDTINLKDDAQGEIKLKISAVCENYMSHYLYMSPKLYKKMFKKAPDYNAIYFESGDATQKELEKIGEKALEEPAALSASYTSDIEGQLDDMLGSLNIVLVVLVVSAGLLAFVVLFNLNNINITERRRELATLRVLGFYNMEVAQYVYRENVILTLIGSLVGLGIGRILHRFLIVTVEIDTAMFGRNVDFSSYIYSILITIGFSAVVNWVMYYKLKKIDMVESLKSVE